MTILPSSFNTALGNPSIDEASCLSPSVILAVFKNYVHVCMSAHTCMCVGMRICAHAWRLTSLFSPSICSFEAGSLSEPKAGVFSTRLEANKPQPLSCLSPLGVGVIDIDRTHSL